MTPLNCKLKKIMLKDTQFLISHGFLDYSMLLAIEKSSVEVDVAKSMRDQQLTRGLYKRKTTVYKKEKKNKLSELLFVKT